MRPSRRSIGSSLLLRCRPHHVANGRPLPECCDFYTIDVADYIGLPPASDDIDEFVKQRSRLVGRIQLEGTSDSLEITPEICDRQRRII